MGYATAMHNVKTISNCSDLGFWGSGSGKEDASVSWKSRVYKGFSYIS
jgi:hypothetical protein